MQFSLRTFFVVCPIIGVLLILALREFGYQSALERSAVELYTPEDLILYDFNGNITLSIPRREPRNRNEVAAAFFGEKSVVDGSTVDALLQMSNLRVLSFDQSAVEKTAFSRLQLSDSIEFIRFGATKLDDEDLLSLTNLQSLRFVDAFESKVTSDGITRFRQARPDVTVCNWYN